MAHATAWAATLGTCAFIRRHARRVGRPPPGRCFAGLRPSRQLVGPMTARVDATQAMGRLTRAKRVEQARPCLTCIS